MSSVNGDNILSVCANCGKGEEESDKLKACTACKLVKYCNRECQIAHRSQHKKECRRRAKEIHEEELFKQPPTSEDCPICFIRIPTLSSGSIYQSCCGKVICCGCSYAPVYDDQGNEVDDEKQNACAFCRVVAPKSEEEMVKRITKRVEADDPIAIFNLGNYYNKGIYGFPQDIKKALELWHRSAELGYSRAYTNIGYAYDSDRLVDGDEEKATYYYELAAMGGSVNARHNLGLNEGHVGNVDRALKHLMIAVEGGYAKSMEIVKELYSNGLATKDVYTKALQLYQVYLGEIKSPQRDKAAADSEECRYY